jgi:hypothetical protein
MKKIIISAILFIIGISANAQNAPGNEKKTFPIHTEKRDLKHEHKDEHHNMNKNDHKRVHTIKKGSKGRQADRKN